MSKRYPEFFAVEILVALDKISRYHQDHNDAQTFYHDDKSFDATMRELQIIGEATKHLLHYDLLEKEYRIIVDFRNFIVHEYFGVDPDEIWDILQHELPRFKNTTLQLLETLDKMVLLEIINNMIKTSSGKTAVYLQSLQQYIQTA